MCVCVLSYTQLCGTPWIVAHQAFLSMGFPRQEYWIKKKKKKKLYWSQYAEPNRTEHARIM